MNTTISISKETRNILQEFGKKSETYDEIIKRMHNSIQMREMLEKFITENEFVSLEDAIEWTKLKNKTEK